MDVDRAYDRMGTATVLGLLGAGAVLGVALSMVYLAANAVRWFR